MAEDRCQHCWRPATSDGHNAGCPIELGTPEAMVEWERGYDYGWDDNHIQWYEERYYTRTFIHGYRVGKTTIDELVDQAAQRNYSYHRGEY